jgi:hypothetical protein
MNAAAERLQAELYLYDIVPIGIRGYAPGHATATLAIPQNAMLSGILHCIKTGLQDSLREVNSNGTVELQADYNDPQKRYVASSIDKTYSYIGDVLRDLGLTAENLN